MTQVLPCPYWYGADLASSSIGMSLECKSEMKYTALKHLQISYPSSPTAPAACHLTLARHLKSVIHPPALARPGCHRCRAGALGELPVMWGERQGGRSRLWKRPFELPRLAT